MNIGPLFADPMARLLYAEIASIEEQHVTQYGSLQDPGESLLEKLLVHEATEVYTYYSCVEQESNPRIKAIWERFLDYEFGHLSIAAREVLNAKGSPTDTVAAGYQWSPGTELGRGVSTPI